MEKNIKILINEAKDADRKEIMDIVDILMKQRIDLVKNEMNLMLGLTVENFSKENVIKCVKLLNEYAERNKIAFHVNEDWTSIEFFLRNSILEDLGTEFKNQKPV